MSRQEGNETPIFSMRNNAAKDGGAREDALVSELARALTDALKAGRGSAQGFALFAQRLVAILAERGGDFLRLPDVATLLEDLYAFMGVATTTSVLEVDERVDDMELRMDDVARSRVRQELMLLQQRIGELEGVLAARNAPTDGDTDAELGTLLGRLTDLEARIDRIPWPDGRPRTVGGASAPATER